MKAVRQLTAVRAASAPLFPAFPPARFKACYINKGTLFFAQKS